MRYQLIEGELYMAPAPNLYHQTISGNLEFIFRAYLEQNPLGILLHAPFDVVFHGESIWQPDIFVVLNANRHILQKQRCEGVPDFIIEILSPNNRELDLRTKRTIYARQGVTEYWIIDPEAKETSGERSVASRINAIDAPLRATPASIPIPSTLGDA